MRLSIVFKFYLRMDFQTSLINKIEGEIKFNWDLAVCSNSHWSKRLYNDILVRQKLLHSTHKSLRLN